MSTRDKIATRLVLAALMVATPRTRARIHIALLRAGGVEPSPRLLRRAEFDRRPGE